MAKTVKKPAHHRFFDLKSEGLFNELSRVQNDGSPSEKGSVTKWLKTEGSRAHLSSQFASMSITQEQAHRAMFEKLLAKAC